MKYLYALAILFVSLKSFGQTNKKNWEKALFEITYKNEVLVRTVVEFSNTPLSKTEFLELVANFASKEQFVDFFFSEEKTLIIYHYQSLDDSGIKTVILPVRLDFYIVDSKLMTLEEVSAIFTSL